MCFLTGLNLFKSTKTCMSEMTHKHMYECIFWSQVLSYVTFPMHREVYLMPAITIFKTLTHAPLIKKYCYTDILQSIAWVCIQARDINVSCIFFSSKWIFHAQKHYWYPILQNLRFNSVLQLFAFHNVPIRWLQYRQVPWHKNVSGFCIKTKICWISEKDVFGIQ